MGGFSKNFLHLVGQLSVAGIIVLGGFHLGFAFFVENIDNKLEVAGIKNFSEQLKNSPKDLEIYIQNEKRVIPSETIEKWFEPYIRNYTDKEDVRISPKGVQEYLASIAPLVNNQPINAKFILVDGKAEEFVPSEYGKSLNIEDSKKIITNAIINGQNSVNLPVELVEPAITLDRVNQLGITTLIGRGESNFSGSPSSRVHNIKVGSARYNGTIIKPGENFSFNDILGEVDEKAGYQPELVIKGGKLIYEYGGGLCQVSTTLFRAIAKAGLPILERKPHSFPVRYYDPQGFDATIYPGIVDLRFKNDTSNHLLIQSRIEGVRLVFDIYGPDDGREVTIDGPYQYNQKQNGAMDAHFIRKITFANGSTEEKRFDSKYGAPAPREKNPLE